MIFWQIADQDIESYKKKCVRLTAARSRAPMINPILFAVLYLSLLNNFDEVRLFFVAETNLEFGLILSILERTCFFLIWSEASWLKGCA